MSSFLSSAGITATAIYVTNFLRPTTDFSTLNLLKICISLLAWSITLQTWLRSSVFVQQGNQKSTSTSPGGGRREAGGTTRPSAATYGSSMPTTTVLGKRIPAPSQSPFLSSTMPVNPIPRFEQTAGSFGSSFPKNLDSMVGQRGRVGYGPAVVQRSSTASKGGPLDRLCGMWSSGAVRPVNPKLEMIESSDRLYATEKIDAKMGEWSDNVRWWLAEMVVKRKIQEWDCTDVLMARAVKFCKKKFPNEQFDKLDTPQKQSIFFQDNKSLLPNQWHEWIDQRKKLEKELILRGIKNQTDYVLTRLADLNAKPFFGDYQYRGGAEWNNQKWNSLYPTDAEILMTYFRYFAERFTTPVIIFSESHFIQLSSANEQVVVGKHKFDRVAIVESPRPPPSLIDHPMSQHDKPEREPYYYLVYDPVGDSDRKKDGVTNGPNTASSPEEDLSEQFWGKTSATTEGKPFPTWFPRPGPGNIFHCLALFAYFVKSRLKDSSLHDYLEHPDCLFLKILV